MTPLFDFALPESGRACRECGSAIIKKPGPGRFPAYCSDECRQAESLRRRLAQEKRPQRADSGALRTRRHRRHSAGDHSLCDHATCWICGKPMISHGAERPTCGACSQKYGRGVCSECGGPKRVDKPGPCRRCYKRAHPSRPKAEPGNCKLCEEPYVPRKAARPDQSFCSKSCKTAWQMGARPPFERRTVTGMALKVAQARTRRLRHAQTWDGITDEEILERDRWRCGICRKVIGKKFKYPHPRSKSIDHIIPLSYGGDDTAVNKRAAHLGCNVARGDKMGEEQLPLFGSVREPPLATVTAGERAAMFQPRKRRVCPCGAVPLKSSKFCQVCFDRRAAEIESRRTYPTSPVHYYTCRYCGDLKVCRRTGQPREVCPARTCQLARLAANNLRTRQGMTAEEADALVTRQVAAAMGPGYGRWQHGAAQRPRRARGALGTAQPALFGAI